MTAGGDDPALVARARQLARTLLHPLPERVQHTQGVANRAAEVAVTVPPADRCMLVAAAWLHDIGYSPLIRPTGFHPLDGGLYLRDHGWDERLVSLVAHHSGARFVPVARGFATLMADFPFEDSAVSDALTFADQTVGPHGRPMTVPYRIAEAIARHGPDSLNALARVDRVPYLLVVADRVEKRLANHLGDQRPAGWPSSRPSSEMAVDSTDRTLRAPGVAPGPALPDGSGCGRSPAVRRRGASSRSEVRPALSARDTN